MLYAPEDFVYWRLASSPRVCRYVGFQIYPLAVPKGAEFPFIVYRRANITRENTLSAPLLMPEVNLQIASWAMTHDECRRLADECRLSLNAHTGTVGGITIHDIRLVSETDDYLDPTVVGAQLPPAYETRQLYQIRWTESAV